jgi:hypothetical protein
MITHTHRPLRVVLYEGNGSIALPAESRAKVMMALLDQGYTVTRSGQGASAMPHDDRSLLVLGSFEGKAPALEDATATSPASIPRPSSPSSANHAATSP